MVAANEVAASIMEHYASHSAHGYTQGSGRWGDRKTENVKVGGGVFKVACGDRDCSSGVISAYEAAGVDVDATYTGNMKDAFLATGMFEWKPMNYRAKRGDIYLNHVNHTAMCVDDKPDKLAEFFLNERGGITGGKKGDQTGGECRIANYYDFPWDGILHYNGKADTEDDMTPEQAAQLQFIYDHLHWRESDHYSDLGNLVAEFPIEYETWEDGKREPLTQPLGKRIGFIDQRIHVIEENQAAIMDALEEIRDAIDMTR